MSIRRLSRQSEARTELEVATRRAELAARMAEQRATPGLPADVAAAYDAARAQGMPEVHETGFAHERLAAVTDAVRDWQALTSGGPCHWCGSVRPRRDDPRQQPHFTTVNGHAACGACAGIIGRSDEWFLCIQAFNELACLRRGVPIIYAEALGRLKPAGELGYSGLPWGHASRESIQRYAISKGARPRDFIGPDAPPADWFEPAPEQKFVSVGVDRSRDFEEWQRAVDKRQAAEAQQRQRHLEALARRDAEYSQDEIDAMYQREAGSEREVIRAKVGDKNLGRAKAALDRHGARPSDLHPLRSDGAIVIDKPRKRR